MSIFEYLLNEFWCPVEMALMLGLPKLSLVTEKLMMSSGRDCNDITNFGKLLQSNSAFSAASYLLSSFFLMCALHATRCIDFRLLL